MVALKTLLFTLVVPGTVVGLIPWFLLTGSAEGAQPASGVGRIIGPAVIVLGLAIYGWCASVFTFTGRGTPAPIDPPKQLVHRGLYQYMRNPMYVGILSIILGEAALFHSGQLAIYAGFMFLLFNCVILFYEEPTLRRKFGETYIDYCRRVPRWLPRLKQK